MQIQLMKQFCGCARYVYNRTLSLERSIYKKDNKHSFKSENLALRLGITTVERQQVVEIS